MLFRYGILFVGVISAPVFAQGHLYTPATGTDVEGTAETSIFGWAANQGHRFMDFSHTGRSQTIKGVSFRLDGRSQQAIGRTWSKVTIRIAHGDWSSIQYNKSNAFRLVDTPITVFDKTWSFPALNGKPPLDPASWGGVGNSLNFRFSTPWVYNGKDAIFFEFTFSGGKAANNQPWIGTTPKGFEYYLDSMPQSAWRGGASKQSYPDYKSAVCYDSAYGTKVSASLDASVSGTSTVSLDMSAYYTSPTDPVLVALSVAGTPSGVDVGGACNLFYPDLHAPLAILVLTTPSKGVSSANVRAPRQSAWTDFWLQAAWFDSKTRAFKLTNAMRVSATPGRIIPVATSYIAGSTKFSVWTAAAKGLPYMRYDI